MIVSIIPKHLDNFYNFLQWYPAVTINGTTFKSDKAKELLEDAYTEADKHISILESLLKAGAVISAKSYFEALGWTEYETD